MLIIFVSCTHILLLFLTYFLRDNLVGIDIIRLMNWNPYLTSKIIVSDRGRSGRCIELRAPTSRACVGRYQAKPKIVGVNSAFFYEKSPLKMNITRRAAQRRTSKTPVWKALVQIPSIKPFLFCQIIVENYNLLSETKILDQK